MTEDTPLPFVRFLADTNLPIPPVCEDTEAIEAIWRLLMEPERGGGATYSLRFGDQRAQPLYAIGLHPRLSKRFPLRDFASFSVHLQRFLDSNRDLLQHPRCCVGIWIDNGIVWLDVSVLVYRREAAYAFSKAGNQIAMFSLEFGEVITTEGTGAARKDLPSPQERLDELALLDVYSLQEEPKHD